MSIHKLTAGSGYDYLTRQVAALDATEKGHVGLASYYTERGEIPGAWIGSGMASIDGLNADDAVTAEQMRALFGAGLHPLAAMRLEQLVTADLSDANIKTRTRLGAPFKVYAGKVSPFQIEVAKRIAARHATLGQLGGEPVSSALRARVRTEVAQEFFRSKHGRDPIDAREIAATIAKESHPRTQTVAGYDLTFSPVKSVSTLWAVADPHVAARIESAHQAAVKDALNFIEGHALFTRQGRNGVRQVNVTGLVAAAFTHRDSRAGDPDLHTHVAVANKVQTLDGRWLAIDGRVLFKATVAASETYNTALEHHLHDSLGVRFAERGDTDPRLRPIREIVGVDPALNRRWSARRVSIESRRGELATQFQRDHGRPPTPVEMLNLAQQATLETRHAKHEPRTLTEQRITWHHEAAQALGGPQAVQAMVHAALSPSNESAPTIDGAWVAAAADRMLAAIEGNRSTWQSWHVRAEAQRQIRAADIATDKVGQLVELLVAEVLNTRSIPLTRTDDSIVEPVPLRGPTAPRSTSSLAPSCSPRPESFRPSDGSSPPRVAPMGAASTRSRLGLRCWSRRRTGLPWIRGRPGWSDPWPAPVPGCSLRLPQPVRERPQRCGRSLTLGLRAAARCSVWRHPQLQPHSSATTPAHPPTHSPNSPGPSTI